MAGSLNKVVLIGNLGRDPDFRSSQNGGKVCNFAIATSETWKDRNTERLHSTHGILTPFEAHASQNRPITRLAS